MGERIDTALAAGAAMAEAHASMQRGCAFLISRSARDAPVPEAGSGEAWFALRRAGNCLREMDRFLCLLLDGCAAAAGMTGAALEAFERSHDAARKLRRIEALGSLSGHHEAAAAPRLEAIARLRRTACGERRGTPRGAPARDLALATAGLAKAPEHALRLSEQALGAMAVFYLALADVLVARFAQSAPILLHSALRP